MEITKLNYIIYGPPGSIKAKYIRNYSSLQENAYVFNYDKDEWKGYNTLTVDYFLLLKDIKSFSNSFIMFDDNGDKVGATEKKSLNVKRHAKIKIYVVVTQKQTYKEKQQKMLFDFCHT